jgi:hypothetical protein
MAATHVKFYNVTDPVGPGQPNKRSDVMLVQFFLKEIGDFWGMLGPSPNGMGLSGFDIKILRTLDVNGSADQNLYEWIKWFQSISSLGGSSAAQDGIVSPAISAYHKGTHSGVAYSIVKMNNAFNSFFPQRWEKLPSDGKVPGELKSALTSNKE